jgi:hypothetical protein
MDTINPLLEKLPRQDDNEPAQRRLRENRVHSNLFGSTPTQRCGMMEKCRTAVIIGIARLLIATSRVFLTALEGLVDPWKHAT